MARRRLAEILAAARLAEAELGQETVRGQRDAKNVSSISSALSSLVPELASAGFKAYDVAGQTQLARGEQIAAENPNVGMAGQPTAAEALAKAKEGKEDFNPFGMLDGIYAKRDTKALQSMNARADANRDRETKEAATAATRERQDGLDSFIRAGALAPGAGARVSGQRANPPPAGEDDDILAPRDYLDEGATELAKQTGISVSEARMLIEAEVQKDELARMKTSGRPKTQEELDALDALAEYRRAAAAKARRAPPPKDPALEQAKRDKALADAERAKAAAKSAQDKAAEGTTAEQKARAAIAASDRMMSNIDKMLAEKAKFNTGAIMSRAKDLGNVVGWKTPGWATFKARTVSELNKYIQQMTGASAGVEEMKRLASVMATPTLDDEEFMELLLLFKEESAAARAEIVAMSPQGAAAPPTESYDDVMFLPEVQ